MRSARILLLLTGTLILLAISLALSCAAIEGDPPPAGDWQIIGQVEFTSNTGYVDGNLLIATNAQLTIEDSTLVINNSLTVDPYGALIITNSTIKFRPSLTFESRFDVMDWATVTIQDTDNDRRTTDDASVIMSDTPVNFQWLVMDNATFVVRNSFISDCGQYSPGPVDDDGLRILSNHAVIEGTNITNGYHGLIVEGIEGLKVDNTTVSDCHTGIILVGTRDSLIMNSRFVDNGDTGILVRGFHGNLVITDVEASGNARANIHMLLASGYANAMRRCTVGPGGSSGILLEEIGDWDIHDIEVVQCQKGIDIDLSSITLTNVSVSDCSVGVIVRGDSVVRWFDLQLEDTTITIEYEPWVNITAEGMMAWTDVVADLSCNLEVMTDGVMELERCQISFLTKESEARGFRNHRRGTLYIYNSTVNSPASGEWFAIMEDGSRTDVKWSNFSDLGTSSLGPREMGLFIGGGGTMEELTIVDSLVGLVIGRANANFINITIRDCQTGIITDGDLGRGGAAIEGLVMDGCDVTILARNSGSLSVKDGAFHLGPEDGLNLSRGTVTLTDSWVSDPASGMMTAVLRDLSTLNLVNSVTSEEFDIGPNQCIVNIYWYLNLTLKYLSNGSPLSGGLVTVREVSGVVVHRDLDAGIDGILEEIPMREKSLTPNEIVMTPHTVTVSKDALKDSFTILMDGSKDHTLNMDNYPPVLIVEHPEDGSLLNVSSVTFSGEAWDAVVTVTEGLASMAYRVNESDWVPIELPAVKAWSFDLTLEDGFYVVEVEVYDKIGNHNSTIVTMDVVTQIPNLVLLSPEEGTLTSDPQLLVIGHTDPGIVVMVNGVEVNVSWTGAFNITIVLEEGLNALVVTASDVLGNTAVEMRNVTLDTIPPEVILDDPGPYVTKESTHTLSGSKEIGTTIYVNGFLHEYIDDDMFITTIDLEEGLNSVLIFSVDLAGNNWTKTIIIDRDSTPPALSVARLPENTNDPSVTVQGSTDDPDAIITVNGEALTLSGLTFAHTLVLTEGENTITVEARDALGNSPTPDVQVVNVDTIPPILDVDTPKYVSTIDDEQNISGETEAGMPVVVFVSYKVYSKTYNVVADPQGKFEVTVALPQVGNHSVTVTVIDPAGNKVTKELYFERTRPDVKPPPKPDEPSWFEENWTVVILLAAIIGAGAILLFTHSSVKQRKEAMRARAQARMQSEEEWEEASEDDKEDEEFEDDEVDEVDEELEEDEDDEEHD